MPADILKIDHAFVAELGHSDTDTHVIAAVVTLAQRLGIQTVAEGMETEPQMAILRAMKCDLLQGYLFSRPLPSDQLHPLIGSHHPLDPGQLDRSIRPRHPAHESATTR